MRGAVPCQRLRRAPLHLPPAALQRSGGLESEPSHCVGLMAAHALAMADDRTPRQDLPSSLCGSISALRRNARDGRGNGLLLVHNASPLRGRCPALEKAVETMWYCEPAGQSILDTPSTSFDPDQYGTISHIVRTERCSVTRLASLDEDERNLAIQSGALRNKPHSKTGVDPTAGGDPLLLRYLGASHVRAQQAAWPLPVIETLIGSG